MVSHETLAAALWEKLNQYLPEDDVLLVRRAYERAFEAHGDQTRASGDLYITHPLSVALMLANWRLDAQAIAASLLHDVLEDTPTEKKDLAAAFGSVVAELVDSVSKLNRLDFSSYQQAQAENFRKILLAMARDVRVILIKLIDRLHNMQTLDVMRPEKRRRIARETVDIYVPIAQRLGLNALRRNLLDLSFRNLYPNRHDVLSRAMDNVRKSRYEKIDHLITSLRETFQKSGLAAEINGRERMPFTIYAEAKEKRVPFEQITQSYDIRVLVETRAQCYAALGILHETYKPIPGRFKDFIALPKNNGYQSLHTTLLGPDQLPINAQIRTKNMDLVADFGIVSYWLFQSANDFVQLVETQQETRRWLKSLLDMPVESDSIEFVNNIKRDLFPDEIYVFTPKGEIRLLPRGATVLDFAYSIHTDIGRQCIGAKINHEVMPIRTVLRTGNIVEILTDPKAQLSPTWLSFVVTGRARAAIRQHLKSRQEEEAVTLGEELLKNAMSQVFKIDKNTLTEDIRQGVAKNAGLKSEKDLLEAVGRGRLMPFAVAQMMSEAAGETKARQAIAPNAPKSDPSKEALPLPKARGDLLRFASCCRPLPFDPIIGVVRAGLGVEIHVRDCAAIKKSSAQEIIHFSWNPDDSQAVYLSEVMVWVKDRPGLLADLSAAIARTDTNIAQVLFDRSSPELTIAFLLDVKNRTHLAEVLRALKRIPGVNKVMRKTPFQGSEA
ncbi:MAG: bifunctional (p)ppGpp synthetase/guanosine-3',5'-bis(diphosphate) 3'-pyrophosphohydrolase [Burkholderiales bacterium]|nr:bifunctional (p)ppGpp synthetase/guanosine-3',5'-bis(diphosphate) 3'-pyrophosphohydrolase [Burkholderiales bacterium]